MLTRYHFPSLPECSVQLHELGHNLGLGHAGEDGAGYGDGSCYMGYGGGDVKMCYNGETKSVLCDSKVDALNDSYTKFLLQLRRTST